MNKCSIPVASLLSFQAILQVKMLEFVFQKAELHSREPVSRLVLYGISTTLRLCAVA